MNKDEAYKIIRETFEKPFDKKQFIYFIKSFLKNVEESPFMYRGNYLTQVYDKHISSLERIGKYTDGDYEIDILVVFLKKEMSLERARTMQRNFIAWYLNGSRGGKLKDAALVAFVSPDSSNWRFSLVKMDYKFIEDENGKTKVKEEFTPARRWSFLVGQNESSHTAQKQVIPFIEDEKINPNLNQLEKVFDIETVTKEFFEKYRELFLRVKDSLEKVIKSDSVIKKEFEEKLVNTVDFSKKLLGQIVFLYFLQKKGWFGVDKEKNWGTGHKNFLRLLFEKRFSEYSNFFNDILEPLFYEALAKERDKDYYSRFKCKIPFLNGGLFDPINNYDWVDTDIKLPDDLFSNNVRTKEGDIGNGILDIFDRYNFTVKEDEPLEKEVAVDPEMLGKIFEKLCGVNKKNFNEWSEAIKSGKKQIEMKFNKKYGVYYTPREIVHYMCQQSLINYLSTELASCHSGESGNPSIESLKQNIEKFIEYGETVAEYEAVYAEKSSNPKYKGKYSKPKLSDIIEEKAVFLDQKLAEIKICDPACGSGAFLVGMMTEIIKARTTLSAYLQDEEKNVYDFKRDAIQNSLYGVDIDPGAVEIAKLRLWLSLIVDEDEYKLIKPLPNLDYKIMQGNSLIEEYEGIKLFDEKFLKRTVKGNEEKLKTLKEKERILSRDLLEFYKTNPKWMKKKCEDKNKPIELIKLEKEITEVKKSLKYESDLFQPEFDQRISQMLLGLTQGVSSEELWTLIRKLHNDYFQLYDRNKKLKVQEEIENLNWQLIESTLRENNQESGINKLQEIRKANTRPFFLWKLYFAEVFQEKGGFDVVIGNPPYLRIQGIKESSPNFVAYAKKHFKSALKGNWDLYVLFTEMGYELLSNSATLAYIQPHKFFQSDFGLGLRNYIAKEKSLLKIICFGAEQMFDSATNYTCLFFLQRIKHQVFSYTNVASPNAWIQDQNKFPSYTLLQPLENKKWNFTCNDNQLMLEKICNQSTKLKDITRKIFVGLQTSADKIYVLKIQEWMERTILVHSISLNKEIEIEIGFVKPFLMGKDVKRYANSKPLNVVIYPYHIKNGNAQLMSLDFIKTTFPLGWKYIKENKTALEQRESGRFKDTWWQFGRIQNLTEFESVKIMTPDIANRPQFTIDCKGVLYHTTTVFSLSFENILKKELYYYLGLLNSNLMSFFMSCVGTTLRGGYTRFHKQYIENFPIKNSEKYNIPISSKVTNILSFTQSQDYLQNQHKQVKVKEYEKQIDQLVYELYGLTEDEIKIVEESAN